MSNEAGRTVGIYVGPRSDVVERFDDAHDCGRAGPRSRSAAIKRAMERSIGVEGALSDAGLEFESVRSERIFIREAIRAAARADADSGGRG